MCTLGLGLLSLACAGRGTGAPSSRLLTTRCAASATGQSHGAITVKAQQARSAPDGGHVQLDGDYVRLTVSALRGGHADSVIAHVADDSVHVPALTPGVYRIEVRALGYQSVSDTLPVGPGEWWCLTAHLVAPDFPYLVPLS